MITKEQALEQLRSVFDQILATGGVKSMKDALALNELLTAIERHLGIFDT
jgi:hypothetical protein